MNKEVILFCNPHPKNAIWLDSQREMRIIQKITKDNYNIITCVTINEIKDGLKDYNPKIFHFACHGKKRGNKTIICLENTNGNLDECEDVDICNIFKIYGKLECVIVNACNSTIFADKLASFIPNVIGMKEKPSDSSSVFFADGFYNSLIRNQDYKTAFEAGKYNIKTNKGGDWQLPYLANVEFNIDNIASDILKQKCILFLGPDLDNDSQHKDFFDKLQAKYSETLLKHENDELIVFKENAIKHHIVKIKFEIDSYFENGVFCKEVLEKIAEIPFHTIVTATADTSLKKVMVKKKIQHSLYTHKKSKFNNRISINVNDLSQNSEPESIEYIPDPDNPAIFHLFGCVEDTIGPRITHHDVFSHIFNVFRFQGKKSNFDTINSLIRTHPIDTLLFIGFQLDKWYYQLLLFLLDINNNNRQRSQFSTNNQYINDANRELGKSMFNIVYINQKPGLFVDQLYDKIKDMGHLRSQAVLNSQKQ